MPAPENIARRSDVVAVIPARYGSTRFPGKPLVDLDGVPMIVRVARQAALTGARVVVATDDARIEAAVRSAGFEAVQTPPDCASGTDRVAAAVTLLGLGGARLILNVQGDEPLIDPEDLLATVDECLGQGAPMGTLARPLEPARFESPTAVKVVRAQGGRALYFSRAPIPWGCEKPLLHVGIYVYTPECLLRLSRLPPSTLELTERLEQLRALEDGIPIHVALARSTAESIAIDVPEDVSCVVAALRDRASQPSQRTTHATR